jgi:hypothetical protein
VRKEGQRAQREFFLEHGKLKKTVQRAAEPHYSMGPFVNR